MTCPDCKEGLKCLFHSIAEFNRSIYSSLYPELFRPRLVEGRLRNSRTSTEGTGE